MHSVPVIGLVGGVGSGKSSVARAAADVRSSSHSLPSLVSRSVLVIVSGDVAGHEVLRQADVCRQIRDRFGDSVFDDRGEVNRSALGRLVFGSANQQALRSLEAIVHPMIRRQLEQEIEDARNRPEVKAILLDAAILLESGWRDVCDAVVFVDTPEQERLKRVSEGRGWSAEQFHRREASQWPLERKRAAADGVVRNDGDLEVAGRELLQWIDRLVEPQNR